MIIILHLSSVRQTDFSSSLALTRTKEVNASVEHSDANDAPSRDIDSSGQIAMPAGDAENDESIMETADDNASVNDNSNIETIEQTKKVGHRFSNVWNHMETEGVDKARCQICGAILSRKNGGTTGLRKHLLRVHKLRSVSIVSIEKRPKPSDLAIDEQKKLNSLIVRCIIEDGRAFGDMRRSGVLRLIDYLMPGYCPPHRNSVQRQLSALHGEKIQLLKKQLSAVHSIAVTCDLWCDRRLFSYICLTGHYINSKFEQISTVIGFASFPLRHYSTNIARAVRDNLQKLNVYEKTTTITTDGASNMVKMFEALRPELAQIYCVAHRLHLCICNGLGLWLHHREKKTTSSSNDLSNSGEESETSDEELFQDEEEESSIEFTDDDLSVRSEGRRLILHSDKNMETNSSSESSDLTDVDETERDSHDHYTDIDDNWSRDVLVDFDPSSGSLEQDTTGKLMNRCRSFIRLVRKSSILKGQVNRMKKEFNIKRELQLDCKSRWNSSFRLVETMLVYKKLINRLNSEKDDLGLTESQTQKLASLELDKSDWLLIESLEYVLRPFLEATKLVSGRKYSTIGMSFFAVVQIRDFLEDTKSLTTNNSNITSRLKTLLLIQMDKYFVKDDVQWNIMKKHAYFDPLGFGVLGRGDRRAIEQEVQEMYQEIATEPLNQLDDDQCDLSSSMIENSSRKRKHSNVSLFLNSLDTKRVNAVSNKQNSKSSTISEEICAYRSLAQKEFNLVVHGDKNSDTVGFWKSHRYELKNLCVIASRFINSPATSVPSESAFSMASYLYRQQRSRLSPSNLSYSVFLKDKMN